MNANELADKLLGSLTMEYDCDKYMEQAATMLRQQADEIKLLHQGMKDGFDGLESMTALCKAQADQLAKYKYVLESIANEYVELSHDKIKWQNEDHIKWAKEALK
jgi:predicted transcriptional regulator with HTH domain